MAEGQEENKKTKKAMNGEQKQEKWIKVRPGEALQARFRIFCLYPESSGKLSKILRKMGGVDLIRFTF